MKKAGKEKEGVSKSVTIYSTPTCVFCAAAKKFFGEHDVKYEEFNVASNLEKRQEMVDKSGQLGVPVISIGSEVIVGFNEGRLRKLLAIED